jgi:hypothetical protein
MQAPAEKVGVVVWAFLSCRAQQQTLKTTARPQQVRLTEAIASEKVGCCLSYQAAVLTSSFLRL